MKEQNVLPIINVESKQWKFEKNQSRVQEFKYLGEIIIMNILEGITAWTQKWKGLIILQEMFTIKLLFQKSKIRTI